MYGGLWDVSAGGHSRAGEDSAAAAHRELLEELGLDVDFSRIDPALCANFPHGFDDYYVIDRDVEPAALTLQASEVDTVKWVDRAQLKAMVGYLLRNTVTENGYVSRGVCRTENGFLTGVTERTHIEKRGADGAYTEDGEHYFPLSGDTIVSMARHTARYTAGGSSSLPVDTAQALLTSLRFTLGLDDPARQRALLETGFEQGYREGVAALQQRVARGKRLWAAVCAHPPEVTNRAMVLAVRLP